MNRLIAHVLQKSGYIAVFIGLAYVVSRAIDSGTDKRDPSGIVYAVMPIFGLILILCYGAFLRRAIPSAKMIWIWLCGLGVYLAPLKFIWFYDIYWDGVVAAFKPEMRFGVLLETIGCFYSYVVAYWMPTAGFLSGVAFVSSAIEAIRSKRQAEQGGDGDAEEAV